MVLRHLRLQSFRAHQQTEVSFSPGVNLLHGFNGVGKTNILEAIHYLCLSKSFLAAQDSYALRQGEPYFELEGSFEGEVRKEVRVRLVYMPGEGKRMFINGAPLERLSDIVGILPVVVFAPEDQSLTAGGPDERRRFLNNILSQARPVYMDDLVKYRRALKQRNELLSQYRRRSGGPPPALIAPWDEELVTLGSRIVAARSRFLEGFREYLARAYAHIEDVAEKPGMKYATIGAVDGASEVEVAEIYRRQISQQADRESERGMTLVGPHRDEVVFKLGGMDVRRYASQGQHRTLGMAIKLAKYFYLYDRLEEHPLLLLDDIFDHLDRRRMEAFLKLLQGEAVTQTIITATHPELFGATVAFDGAQHRAILVEDGGAVAPLVPGGGEGM